MTERVTNGLSGGIQHLYAASTIVFLLEKSFYQQTYDRWLTGTEQMRGILVFDNKMDKEKVIALRMLILVHS